MSDRTLKQMAVSESGEVAESTCASPSWTPRSRNDCGFNTNPFENFDISGGSVLDGASLNQTVTIRDATVDTAPLQGSKDISDDDYLGCG